MELKVSGLDHINPKFLNSASLCYRQNQEIVTEIL